MSASQELPSKEANLFKTLIKHYDAREYKKAVNVADQILTRFPEHGETISMKGLCHHALEIKDGEEASYKLAKLGIEKNMRSRVTWHAFGLIHKIDKNYAEAIKCHKMALRWDATNLQILRDLAVLYIHTRDWENFVDTRQKLVAVKPGVRAHWIGLAVGHYKMGHHTLASASMDTLVSIMEAGDSKAQTTEVHLFRAELALQGDEPQRALDILTESAGSIHDPPTVAKLRARAFEALGNTTAAIDEYHKLIEMREAEADAVVHIARLRGVTVTPPLPAASEETGAAFVAILDELRETFPKIDCIARLTLDYCRLSEFTDRLRQYCTRFVVKTIPSLFSVLKSLYTDPRRAELIGSLFATWLAELERGDYTAFLPTELGRNPALMVWVLAFLASHQLRIGQHDAALVTVDRAIAHTPTVEFLYLLKAKILQRLGNFEEAAKAADVCRTLDLQDRYLNAKCVKYMLRAGHIEEAERTLQLFLKPTDCNDTYLHVFELQCAWFERELGNAFLLRGDPISAVQCLALLEKHHEDTQEDLYEFHSYSHRMCTMRAWLDTMDIQENFIKTPFFIKGARGMLRALLRYHALGAEAARAAHVPRPELPALPNADENKARQQLYADFNLNVDKLLVDPLASCDKYVAALQSSPAFDRDAEARSLLFDVYSTKKKLLLMVKEAIAYKAASSSTPGFARNVSIDARVAATAQRCREMDAAIAALYNEDSATMDARVRVVVDEAIAKWGQ